MALYARVFPAPWFQKAAIASIALFVVQDVIFLVLITIRCLPVQAIWDIRVEGRCLDLNRIGLAGAILHIVEHFALLAVPVPELWRLKLSRKKKVQLLMVFSIGSLCVFPLFPTGSGCESEVVEGVHPANTQGHV